MAKCDRSGFDDSNLYEIVVDGTGREFDPFFHREDVEVFEGDNSGQIVPSEYIEDKPAAVDIEILVGGNNPSDNSTITFYLPTGAEVTKNSRNGIFKFGLEDGIGSHPFDKFAREYTVFLNPHNTREANRFEPKEYQLNILGDSTDIVLDLENFPVPTVEFIDLGDGWEMGGAWDELGPEGSSGLTMNPQDHTLWIIDFFDDYIHHYTTEGNDIGDGCAIPNTAVEGGTYDTTDDTFWLVDARGDSLVHYTKTGQRLEEDSFELTSHGFPNALGITFDPTDSTLWVADANSKMGHFDRKGNLLPGGFRVGPGMRGMRGMCFDPRDSTLIVLNIADLSNIGRINKIDPETGVMIWQSNNIGEIFPENGLPEGIVFDDRDSSFWFHDLSSDYMYHIKAK